jgi:hypothetical protein
MNEEAPTALAAVPANKNFLSNAGFRLVIRRAPHINFFAQKIDIPGISITPPRQGNPFVSIPHSGEHIEYEPLAITFKVDEDLLNYLEIHDWIKALGFPDNFSQYADLKRGDAFVGKGLSSEISLFILTSHRNPSHEVIFREAFPFQLSALQFDSTLPDVEHFEATAVFTYTSYKIVPV